MSVLIKSAAVLKSAGVDTSKLPKLAVKDKLKEAILFGSRSAYRACLGFFDAKIVTVSKTFMITVKVDETVGVSPTVASASIGALVAATKAHKQAMYLTLCALGLSDHPESLVKTIYGNTTKWTRTDAFKRYESDLRLVAYLEANPALLTYVRKTFDYIVAHLAKQAQIEAQEARSAK